MNVLIVLAFALLGGYALLLLTYWIGWLLIPRTQRNNKTCTTGFTILIPARNEEQHIVQCLTDLIHQQYPQELTEIIVIDDHSTDNTALRVQQLMQHHKNLRLLQMKDDPQQRQLKKAAITYGISEASFDHIILTDADCQRKPFWLQCIAEFTEQHQPHMVYAPVLFEAHNRFERIQALEFMGLVGIGGSAIRLKNPNMCSAANLSFRKSSFYEVNGYAGVDNRASGDDEYLLHKIFKLHPNDVYFLKNKEAIVYTPANVSVKQLADQRRRWVSKSFTYEDRYITAILIGAYLFNALIVFLLFAQPTTGLLLLAGKTLAEGLLLTTILHFFGRKSYILLLPLAEVFHILYVLIIGIWANTGTYVWKDRTVR